jgi:FK506-binding nuclear protein
VIPQDDGQASLYDEDDDEDEDYDLSPSEDEDILDALENGDDEESDGLDDLEDPRVTEVGTDEDVPALVKPDSKKGKGKNKRPAEDSDEDGEANLDAIMAKSLKKEEAAAPADADKKLTKTEKKKLKKLKKNDGEAAPVEAESGKKESATNGSSEKKVQFAKNLEQGPTPSATPPTTKSSDKDTKSSSSSTGSLGVKDVGGVSVDDRKLGTGPAAKKGNRIEMRYIGKLDNGKVFDSNKSGKPFAFKLGAGEVIKGWDVGVAGIQVGGERRLVIPAHLAYGSKALPGIPKNSKLTFDIKCLSVK